jgi:hypothetical protein
MSIKYELSLVPRYPLKAARTSGPSFTVSPEWPLFLLRACTVTKLRVKLKRLTDTPSLHPELWCVQVDRLLRTQQRLHKGCFAFDRLCLAVRDKFKLSRKSPC